jgi:hypothetical protein
MIMRKEKIVKQIPDGNPSGKFMISFIGWLG